MVESMWKSLVCLALLCSLTGMVRGEVEQHKDVSAGAKNADPEKAAPVVENFELKLTGAFAGPNKQTESAEERGHGRSQSSRSPDPNFFESPAASPFVGIEPAPARTSAPIPRIQGSVKKTNGSALSIFCEDVQLTAKPDEAGEITYEFVCAGHVRIKTPTSTTIGTNASYKDGTIQLNSAQIVTSDAVIEASEISFAFELKSVEVAAPQSVDFVLQ